MKSVRKLCTGLLILVILTPLGLLIPSLLGADTAWGEWSPEELGKMLGRIPAGVSELSSLWKAPVPDYALRGHESAPLPMQGVMYFLSAALGAVLVTVVIVLIGRFLTRNENSDNS